MTVGGHWQPNQVQGDVAGMKISEFVHRPASLALSFSSSCFPTFAVRKLALHTVVLIIMDCPEPPAVPVLAETLIMNSFYVAYSPVNPGHRLRGVRGEGTEVGLLTRRQRTGCWDARHYHSILAPLLFSPGMAGMMADSDSSQLRGSSEPISSILP